MGTTRDGHQPRQRPHGRPARSSSAPAPTRRRPSCSTPRCSPSSPTSSRHRSPSASPGSDRLPAPGGGAPRPARARAPGGPSARTSWSTRTPSGASPGSPASGPGDHVVEIGAGLGALTRAPRRDRRRRHRRRGRPRARGGARGRDRAPRRPRRRSRCPHRSTGTTLLAGVPAWALVANLPYNVATPLVADLLDGVPAITRMLVMVQREVAERLAAGPGHDGVRGRVGEGRLLGHRRRRGAGARRRSSCPDPRWSRPSSPSSAGRRPPSAPRSTAARLFALVRAGLRAAAQDAPALARRPRGARRRSRRPASGPTPGPRSWTSRTWGRLAAAA